MAPEPVPVGKLIQRARQRRRLTQAELAAALGVSKNSVVKWESGVHYPSRNAGAIEALLDIEIPEPEPEPETELAG